MEEATKDVKVQLHATMKLEATRFTMMARPRTTRNETPEPSAPNVTKTGRHDRRDVVDEVDGEARGVPAVPSGTRPDLT